ncbi:hypothetical protein KR50_33150 [Jeotgalibacillus campisalis]|uniref:Uncharacterized protein n=1 Tax=Jeotgalibacillus campisalis TaxID=220754 RepID=A0A0C2V1G6_9BACL|nr:hypothetical protein KR50_33150 [Jeotgalibacillus campisalis]
MVLSLSFAALLGLVAIVLSLINGEFETTFFIGSIVVGAILGYWLLPSIVKFNKKNV